MLALLLTAACSGPCPPTAMRALVAGPLGVREVEHEYGVGFQAIADEAGTLWTWSGAELERDGDLVREFPERIQAAAATSGGLAVVAGPWPGVPSYYEPAEAAEGEPLPLGAARYSAVFLMAWGEERWVLLGGSSDAAPVETTLVHRSTPGASWEERDLGSLSGLMAAGLAMDPEHGPVVGVVDEDETTLLWLESGVVVPLADGVGGGIVFGGDGAVWAPTRDGVTSSKGCAVACGECVDSRGALAAFPDPDAVSAIGVREDATMVLIDISDACESAESIAQPPPAGGGRAWAAEVTSGPTAFLDVSLDLPTETDEFESYDYLCK